MTASRDELLRQSTATRRVQELAHAHGFDADAGAQQAIFVALLAYAGEERDALIAALVQEDAAIRSRRGAWAEQHVLRRRGARRALERVAARRGVSDLHARAADAVARADGDAPHR